MAALESTGPKPPLGMCVPPVPPAAEALGPKAAPACDVLRLHVLRAVLLLTHLRLKREDVVHHLGGTGPKRPRPHTCC